MNSSPLLLIALCLMPLLGSGNAFAQADNADARKRAAERRALSEKRRAEALAAREKTARFFDAIERNDIATVRSMLEQGFKANAWSLHGQPDVLVAASKGHMEILALLVENGSTSLRVDRQRRSAIMAAIDNEQWGAVRFLAQREGNLAPALHYAMKQNNQPAIDMLFRLGPTPGPESPALSTAMPPSKAEPVQEALSGADTKARRLRKALFRAIRDKQPAVAVQLIAHGADVHARDAHGNTPLHAAAYQGQLEMVHLLMMSGANVNTPADRGKTPLMLAAQANAMEVARFLLEQGAEVNAGDNCGGTALMYAATAAAHDVAALLLERGAEVNARTENGNAALHCAIMSAKNGEDASLRVVRLLVEHGAHVNANDVNDTGFSPLMWAVQARAPRVATFLLEHGADVNARGTGGETALLWAAHGAQAELIRLLLDRGADVQAMNSCGQTALHHAARRDAAECVRLLIERGAPLDAQAERKETPLLLAINAHATKAAEMLLEKGADKEARNIQSYTPLMLAALSDSVELAELLLRHGADVRATRNDGATALHCLTEPRNKQAKNVRAMVALLVKHGADIHARNEKGDSVLIMAATRNRVDILRELLNQKGQPGHTAAEREVALARAVRSGATEAVEFLLGRGVDINTKVLDGLTPMLWAAQQKRTEMVQLLLGYGADADAANQHGVTALMRAAYRNDIALAQLLLEHGAQLETQDEQGRTALFFAAGEAQPEMVAWLLERGAQVNAQAHDGHPVLSNAMRAYGIRKRQERALKVAELLLENGADLYLHREKQSIAPLEQALTHGDDEVALLLLRYCKDVEQRRFQVQRRSPLLLAVWNDSVPICQELLRRGVDVNAADADKYTALHAAVNGQQVELVRLLLEHGANANAGDKLGYTPLTWVHFRRSQATSEATHRKIDEIERLLREHGARE